MEHPGVPGIQAEAAVPAAARAFYAHRLSPGQRVPDKPDLVMFHIKELIAPDAGTGQAVSDNLSHDFYSRVNELFPAGARYNALNHLL